jgi:hypothetical protein
MTDARLPERWLTDRRLRRLPDAAFRLFITSLLWSVANKTDGVLYDDDLPLIPDVDLGCADRLAKAGLWGRDRDRWIIAVFEDTQTSAAELDGLAARRRADRRRKAAQRRRESAEASDQSRDGSRDMSRDPLRTGQARPGKDRRTKGEPSSDVHSREAGP